MLKYKSNSKGVLNPIKMLCDFCHENEAVIYMEQTVAGQKRKIHMCLECAAERGISPDASNIQSSIGDLFKELADISKNILKKESKLCPVCGISLGEIQKTGTTGCPECYSVFKSEIRSLLESNGIKEQFKGDLPARLAHFKSILRDRMILQNKLNDALQNENYEKAAMYRDYLKALEQNSVSNGTDE